MSGIMELRNYIGGGAMECAKQKGFYTSAVQWLFSEVNLNPQAERGRLRGQNKKDRQTRNGHDGVTDVST